MIPAELPGWPQKFHFPNLEALQIPASHMHIAEHSRMLHYIGSNDYSHYENNNSGHHAYHSERRNHSLHDSIDLQDLYPHKPLHSDSRYQPFSGNFIGVSNMSISLENLSFLKDSIFGKCNKFEALTALFWRERTRLLDFPPSSEVVLFFPAPVAQDVHLAFYGKYGFNCMVTARASELVQSDLSKVVRLIQDAQVEFAGQFLECMRRFIQLHAYETQKHAPRHVLLFTVLSHVVEGFDFGTDVHPYLHGAAHVPCPVNAVAITGCSEDNIEVVITNAPLTLTDKISLHLHQHPMLGSDSKL
ncbi:hypothetical protein KP509_04G072500 [Ceratopteris richardii]|nr:hypothetical protein KP509_04G072500 [Ceratopteris richardii]